MSDRRPAVAGCALVLVLSAMVGRGASDAAQRQFDRGLIALHHFEYEDANQAFVEARRSDPSFVLAYWGEAITYYQPLWRNENLGAARQALARLAPTADGRAAGARTGRDKGLLGAVEVLFGEGDPAARHRGFAEAMGRLASQYPDDPDIVSLHALTLLAAGSRSLIGYGDAHTEGLAGSERQKQIALALNRILAVHPNHPGALHYLLHAYDDPQHASLALPAARTYATIAAGASHALHMPAHIFLQLGLWRDAAAADRAAFAASTDWARRKQLSPSLRNYHALGWLQYELLQLGRYTEARDAIRELEPVVAAPETAAAHDGSHQPLLSDLSSMRARYVIESRRWEMMSGVTTFGNVNELFAIGMAATRTGNLGVAQMAQRALEQRSQAREEGDLRPAIAVMEREMAALIALAAGERETSLNILRAASRAELALPPPMGLPAPIKPAPELLGETLLELGQPAEAAESFTAALARHPNRSLSLLGRARAAVRLRDAATARRTFQALLTNFDRADAGLPEVLEARATIARLEPSGKRRDQNR